MGASSQLTVYMRVLRSCWRFSAVLIICFVLFGCEANRSIVNDVDEREANEIVVFLASKGIPAEKIPSVSSAPGGTEGPSKWSIAVPEGQTTDAMAILNQNGLPRKQGTNLLDLFAKSGFMSSEKEETIRYQAGLAQQIANMIRKIDGVIDAEVQISFPSNDGIVLPGTSKTPPQKITAAVYVKHQGIVDDPNSHLVMKIKRLVAGSVTGLDLNDVTVISDRARFADVSPYPSLESLEPQARDYVSIWSIVLNKESAARFRMIFFVLIFTAILGVLCISWLIWKFYPVLKSRGGFRALLKVVPIEEGQTTKLKETEEK